MTERPVSVVPNSPNDEHRMLKAMMAALRASGMRQYIINAEMLSMAGRRATLAYLPNSKEYLLQIYD